LVRMNDYILNIFIFHYRMCGSCTLASDMEHTMYGPGQTSDFNNLSVGIFLDRHHLWRSLDPTLDIT